MGVSKILHIFLTLCQTKQRWISTKISLSRWGFCKSSQRLDMFILFLYFRTYPYILILIHYTFQHPLPNPPPGLTNWRWEQEGEVCCWQLHGPNCLPPQWDTYHHHCRGVRRHRHRRHHHHLIIINPKNTVLIVCPFNGNIIIRSSSSSWSLL